MISRALSYEYPGIASASNRPGYQCILLNTKFFVGRKDSIVIPVLQLIAAGGPIRRNILLWMSISIHKRITCAYLVMIIYIYTHPQPSFKKLFEELSNKRGDLGVDHPQRLSLAALEAGVVSRKRWMSISEIARRLAKMSLPVVATVSKTGMRVS